MPLSHPQLLFTKSKYKGSLFIAKAIASGSQAWSTNYHISQSLLSYNMSKMCGKTRGCYFLQNSTLDEQNCAKDTNNSRNYVITRFQYRNLRFFLLLVGRALALQWPCEHTQGSCIQYRENQGPHEIKGTRVPQTLSTKCVRPLFEKLCVHPQ